MINESQKWSSIITEEYNVKNPEKLSWMTQYARNHEVYEAMQTQGVNASNGIYSTPLNTLGAGNPMMPVGVGFNKGGFGTGIGDTGADFHNPLYQVGSGDIPMSTLSMSLEIAAVTIGLELVPVIPAPGPWAMLTYQDFPYAGGKLGRLNETWVDGKGPGAENKPIYIKLLNLNVPATEKATHAADFVRNTSVTVAYTLGDSSDEVAKDAKFKFIGFSRIDNSMILEVVDLGDNNASIADVFSKPVTVTVGAYKSAATQVRPDLVSSAADHVQGFANFFKDEEGNGSLDPMTRAQNETGVGNTIGTRIFSKLVQMGAYEVTGSVTRQQIQDYPLYGIDVIGKVLEALQNRISQEINNRILDRVFKLGVENYKVQKDYQAVDLNLFLGDATHTSMQLSNFSAYRKYLGIDGKVVADTTIASAVKNTAAENVTTHQRRIMSRVLAAANLIANVSRWGRGNWVVTNTQVLSALQDCAAFVVAPMTNTLVQDGSKSLYFAGSLAGLNVYVDPYMTWEDTRICVGRKSDGNTPGVVFMPYILADTVQTIVEGTMAPKLLVNSRFAIVDAGFHTEQNYYTFMVQALDDAYLI